MKILLVDDSSTMRRVQQQVIAKMDLENVEFCEAKNGVDALSKAAAEKPDLILLDWNMPEMDGITFLREFRTKDTQTLVMMVTTEAEKARVMEALKTGANNFVIKPFTPEMLAEKIVATLKKAREAA